MANDDRWRNDQERDRYRDQDYGRRQGGRDQGSGRGSDYQGDGTIAQRGFGNERSGYDRERGPSRAGNDYDQGRSEGMGTRYGGGGGYGGDYDQGRSGGGMGDLYGGGGAYGSDYRGGGMAGGRGGREFHGSYPDRGSREGGDRGFWDRASDEVSSWFGDDDAERRRRQDEQRGGDWGGQSHRGRGPKGYTRSDDRIREDVCERLTHDHHVDASEIEISVANREVTLSGTVDSREARRRAEDIAESISGVTHVQNNLRVQQSGMGSSAGMTSGSGTAGNAMAGGAGMTTGSTGQSGTDVQANRTEGGAGRRKTGSNV